MVEARHSISPSVDPERLKIPEISFGALVAKVKRRLYDADVLTAMTESIRMRNPRIKSISFQDIEEFGRGWLAKIEASSQNKARTFFTREDVAVFCSEILDPLFPSAKENSKEHQIALEVIAIINNEAAEILPV